DGGHDDRGFGGRHRRGPDQDRIGRARGAPGEVQPPFTHRRRDGRSGSIRPLAACRSLISAHAPAYPSPPLPPAPSDVEYVNNPLTYSVVRLADQYHDRRTRLYRG